MALLAGLLGAAFVALRLEATGGSPGRFVVAGDRFTDPRAAPPALPVLAGSDGYDGQFYYRLALSPFTDRVTAHGITLDYPAYRQQRILVPLVAWLASGGQPYRAAWALIGLNAAALTAVGFFGSALARSQRRHALWGLCLPLFPGFALSVARDLLEVVAAACLLGGLLALRKQRWLLAGLALSLAVATKETTLVVVLAVAATWLTLGRRSPTPSGRHRWVAVAAPLGTFLAIQGLVGITWGVIPVLSGPPNLGPPVASALRGVVRAVRFDLHYLGTPTARLHLLDLGVMAAVAATSLVALRGSAATTYEKVATLLSLALLTALSPIIWVEEFFLRSFVEFYCVACLVLLGRRFLAGDGALLLTAAMWFVTAAVRINVL